MTYKEFVNDMQSYLNSFGYIKGYASQQERMANKPCHDAINKCCISDRLSIKYSTGAGIFYDIYANVEGQDVYIGCFENNGTIKKQSVKVSLINLKIYGDEELNRAILLIAKDRFDACSRSISERLEVKKQEVKALEDKKGIYDSLLETIEKRIGGNSE